jgi:hypothetical protein
VHGAGLSTWIRHFNALGYGTADASGLIATEGASSYVNGVFFAIVGAALGTAAANAVRFPKTGAIRGLTPTKPAAQDRH